MGTLSLTERALFTRQLALLLKAGMPLAQSLNALQQHKPKQRPLIQSLLHDLHQGISLSRAMAQHPKAFNAGYCAAIHAGEAVGLVPVLLSLAKHLQHQQKVQAQYRQALLYPLLMLAFASCVVVFLLTSILPSLASAVQSSGQTLPWSTRALLALSHHWQQYGLLELLGMLTSSMILWRAYLKKPTWQYRAHTWLLKIPMIGHFCRATSAQACLSTLGLLLSSGIHLPQAMHIAKTLLRWQPMAQRMAGAIRAVESGTPLHTALEQTHDCPPMCLPMIYCGNVNGDLGGAVSEAANHINDQNQNRMRALLALLEPMMILVLGGIVLLIVLATLLPIFNFETMTY